MNMRNKLGIRNPKQYKPNVSIMNTSMPRQLGRDSSRSNNQQNNVEKSSLKIKR